MTSKWPVVRLSKVVTIQGGYAFKSNEYVDSGHYLIRIANVIDDQVIQTDEKYVDLESDPKLMRFALAEGDLLMTLTGNIGRTAIVNSAILPAALNQRVARIHADLDKTSNRYLQYLFSSEEFIRHILGKGHGAAQQNVSTKDLETFEFPLPPLDEQKRIVAKLDEAMDSIVEAERIIGKAVIQLVEFENASREHFLSTTKSNMHVSELSELAEIRYGFTDSASHEKRGPKFLRITDIQDRKVNWSLVPRCEISTDDHEKQRLRSGDLVFARTGATTGKSFLITEDVPDAVAASYLIRVRPNQTRINPRYLSVYFNSREYWESVEDGSTGSAQGGFNASKLGALTIRFPESLQHQSEIVQYSHNLDEQSSGLRVSLLSKATAINSLKGTLLTAAFAGEL